MGNKLINSKLKKYEIDNQYSVSQIFTALTLYIYSLNTKQSDLYILAKLLDEVSLQKLITYYDGDILRMPSKEEFKNTELLNACYYLKEIQGWSWDKIKSFLNLNKSDVEIFNALSLGKQLENIKENLNKDINKMLDNIDENDLLAYIKLYVSNRKKNGK